MNIVSFEYILFFIAVFSVYWLLGNRRKDMQNAVVVVASILFYGMINWKLLGLVSVTVLCTFLAGCVMSRDEIREDGRRIVLLSTIVINIGILLLFKYCNFFIEAIADLCGLIGIEISMSTLHLLAPVGVSFYTFTALSYVIDVYNRKIEVTKDFVGYMAYVVFFPSLLCGPIGRATSQLPQFLKERSFDYNKAVSGCRLILLGVALKVCVADRAGGIVNLYYSDIASQSGTTWLIMAILYSFQIYADFCGYSLMAVGCGKLLGIELQKNFDRPYLAATVTDFWRRWHISLTSWFRDYVYFPLGGNRVHKCRWMLNVMIVFVVSGLWHGANYTFLVWGAIHGVCMLIEKRLYGDRIKNVGNKSLVARLLGMALTFGIVSIAWIVFRADNLNDALMIIGKVFTDQDIHNFHIGGIRDFIPVVMGISVMIAVEVCKERNCIRFFKIAASRRVVRWCVYYVLIIVIWFMARDANEFVYMQF